MAEINEPDWEWLRRYNAKMPIGKHWYLGNNGKQFYWLRQPDKLYDSPAEAIEAVKEMAPK